MSDPIDFLRTNRDEEAGTVTYTGLIPAMLAVTIAFVAAACCLSAVIFAAKLVLWALAS